MFGVLFVLVPLAVGIAAESGIWWLDRQTARIDNAALRTVVRVVLGVVATIVFLAVAIFTFFADAFS